MRAGAGWRQRVFLGALPSTADDARVASVSRRQIDVSVGSKADLTAPKSNFRFTPESRLNSDIAPCPKSAMNGLMRRSKRHLYSITLSARPSSEGGTARPRTLAVSRFTISSDFVGACTHLGLPYESHGLQAPDRKGSTSEIRQ